MEQRGFQNSNVSNMGSEEVRLKGRTRGRRRRRRRGKGVGGGGGWKEKRGVHTISVASTRVPTIFSRTSSSFEIRIVSSSDTNAGGLLWGSKLISGGIS
jgi:hypothetical protein